MIKAVIFDVGGVLIRTTDPQPRRTLEERLGLPEGGAELLVFNSEMGRAAQMGQITSLDHWQWVAEQLNLDADVLLQFQHEFFGGDYLDRDLIAFIRKLRPAYRTAIISNYMDELTRLLGEVHCIADAFDLIVISSSEKIMKPDPIIFERTLQRLNLAPQETIFVDDFPHNVEGARAVGMNAIHFTPGIDLVAELARWGVVIGDRGLGIGD
ncbi:MAG: HAD family phosphatase [Caldilineaceae bacterium]|nr:HAD family phosphatase [Caldilineaceae bacterium]